MNHFEAFTCAKDPARPESNEDQLVLRPGLVLAVIDGATDISGERFNDELGTDAAGGRLAARAMAQALSAWVGKESDEPPLHMQALEQMNDAIAALLRRVGRFDDASRNGQLRFRATFAGAFFWRDGVRLVRLGDSGFRVNGKPVLEHHFPGDTILSAARSAGWSQLAHRGLDADSIRPLARQLIVQGLSKTDELLALGFLRAELDAVAADVLSRPAVLDAVDGDLDHIRQVLAGGLEVIRMDPGAHDALVMDGFAAYADAVETMDIKLEDIETLEVFSDGYPAFPQEVSITAWESVLRQADATDPERIGEYPSTKGCDAGKFGDDRTIIIARNAD